MYKKIILTPGLKVTSARIPKETIATSKRYHSLNEQAKANARNIIRSANQESDAIYTLAYLDGFEQGLGHSIEQLISYLRQSEHMVESIVAQACAHLEKQLKDFFANDDVICSLLEKWLSELDTLSANKLVLTLPIHHRGATERLRHLFDKIGINVEVRFIQTSLITLEHNKVIWSCDIAALPATFGKKALNEVKSHQDIYEACHTNGIHTLRQLQQTLNDYCNSSES